MTNLRILLLATTTLTATQLATSASHAQTAPLVVAQAKDEGPPGAKKEAPKGAPPAAAPKAPAPPPPPAAMENTAVDSGVPATAQLKRGMKMGEVSNLFGPGKQMSQSVSADGLKTQVFEYTSGDRLVDVTYVEGLVVRYSISSN